MRKTKMSKGRKLLAIVSLILTTVNLTINLLDAGGYLKHGDVMEEE